MGLDISAYKKLSLVKNPTVDENGERVNWETEWQPGASMEWSEKYFPGRGEGIEPRSVYAWEDKFDFRAGSYSGYNWWRAKLNEFSNGTCFQELVEFADNEGVIGPVVSKKLLKDFKDNKDRAQEFSKSMDDEGEYWFEKYEAWLMAFEYAAEDGAVEFR